MIFPYEKTEVEESLRSAKNMNAALKSFLKNEIQKGDPAVKFVKALKTTAQSKAPGALSEFLEKTLSKYEAHFFVITRYAHTEVVEPLLDKIIVNYAEKFNQSYTTNEGTKFEYQDQKSFQEIAKEVLAETEKHLQDSPLEVNGFMKNAVFYSLFEPLVIEELKAQFG